MLACILVVRESLMIYIDQFMAGAGAINLTANVHGRSAGCGQPVFNDQKANGQNIVPFLHTDPNWVTH